MVVGGLKIIDRGEADDKIIAVLEGDYVWGNATEIGELPPALLERIEHYFSTYKLVPDQPNNISLTGPLRLCTGGRGDPRLGGGLPRELHAAA